MSLILMTTLFYEAVILQGEIWRWSLLGLKWLKKFRKGFLLNLLPISKHVSLYAITYSGTLLIRSPMGQIKFALLTGWPYQRGFFFFFTRKCMAVFDRRPKTSGRKAGFHCTLIKSIILLFLLEQFVETCNVVLTFTIVNWVEWLWNPSDSFVICFCGPESAQRSKEFLSFWLYWPIKTLH